jgi:hypothetical protein
MILLCRKKHGLGIRERRLGHLMNSTGSFKDECLLPMFGSGRNFASPQKTSSKDLENYTYSATFAVYCHLARCNQRNTDNASYSFRTKKRQPAERICAYRSKFKNAGALFNRSGHGRSLSDYQGVSAKYLLNLQVNG